MSGLALWSTIIGLAVVTLLTRVVVLFLPARFQLSPRLQRALRYAGPCVLMAIVVPDLVFHDGTLDAGFDNQRLHAALVAVVVFLATRSAALMIGAGLLTLTALRLLT